MALGAMVDRFDDLEMDLTALRPDRCWETSFDTPISVGSRKLRTLRDARAYIQSLPASKQNEALWHAAAEDLLRAAEHGGLCIALARLSTTKAILNRSPR